MIDMVADLWSELKRYISIPDRNEAADIMINLLIDNDYDADEIKSAFKGDNDVRHALQSYLADAIEEEEEDDNEDDEDDRW